MYVSEVTARPLSACVRVFLRLCFCVASFLYFQPKNQWKVPEGGFHPQDHEIQNHEQNRKQVGKTF